jgi:signal transduction histidine kinase
VKHAQATELYISIVNEKDALDILIEDNGVGFNLAGDITKQGMGMQNIRSRIHYLNGTVEWDNTGSGTVVAIYIPYHYG